MVYIWIFALVIFCASKSVNLINVLEGTKKDLLLKSGSHDALSEHNDFHCDLNLMPSQQKLMYYEYRLKRNEPSYDLYKWPKNHDGQVTVPFRISKTSLFCK